MTDFKGSPNDPNSRQNGTEENRWIGHFEFTKKAIVFIPNAHFLTSIYPLIDIMPRPPAHPLHINSLSVLSLCYQSLNQYSNIKQIYIKAKKKIIIQIKYHRSQQFGKYKYFYLVQKATSNNIVFFSRNPLCHL